MEITVAPYTVLARSSVSLLSTSGITALSGIYRNKEHYCYFLTVCTKLWQNLDTIK